MRSKNCGFTSPSSSLETIEEPRESVPQLGDQRNGASGLTVHVQAVSPESCPALVLNADFRPLSYYPLSIWCWQDAIKAVFLDRVNILSEYDTLVRAPSFEIRLPSV